MGSLHFDWEFPYHSRRMPVLAGNVVATSQPLAAQAGLEIIRKGGNAVDAALAAAMALTVVEPTSNGIGSDAFALVWDGEALYGLNGSGRAPAAWSRERFAGRETMPILGWDSVTVPGAVDAWSVLSRRFGRLPFGDLLEPAIRYAKDGFLVSPAIAVLWKEAEDRYRDFPEFGKVFLPGGRAPRAGEPFRCPDLARTLSLIAETHGEAFYRGELAGHMVRFSQECGGAMTRKDLEGHRSDWVEPLRVDYAGVTLHEIPPNGQGLAALIALGILEKWGLGDCPVDSADCVHLQVEAMKIAFAEVARHLSDPEVMAVQPSAFLEDGFLEGRAREIRMDRAGRPRSRIPGGGGTVYLATADEQGMMVSFIQSNFLGFGSGVVVPGTGISLQNRGFGFVLAEGHPNCVGGGKRPYHTIIPGFVTTPQGTPLVSFGVMGGHMQPQGHVQVMVRLFSYGQNPQAVCDAPRWHVTGDFRLAMEPGFPPGVAEELERRGHVFEPRLWPPLYGGAQLIYRLGGGYCAASDPRKDGQAVGF